MPLLLRTPPRYAELVFHVLAHVRRSAAAPASVYDPDWIEHSRRTLGDASERTLAEDAEALGVLAPGHEDLARAQLVAWLFRDHARARACATRDLSELRAEDVDAPELLEPLTHSERAAELLRVAAELEAPFFDRLPAAALDWAPLEAALTQLVAVAPELGRCTVAVLRPLRLRGRVRGSSIWIGAPDLERGPGVQHVAWQAAHEATVREVGLAARAAERRVEQMAVVLLATRAERGGARLEHLRWLAHFGPNAPDASVSALSNDERSLVYSLMAAA